MRGMPSFSKNLFLASKNNAILETDDLQDIPEDDDTIVLE